MKPSGDFSIGSNVWPGISKLIEECGETVQVCGKLLGSRGQVAHWDGSDLKERLEEEIADLLAAIDFVSIRCGLNSAAIIDRRVRKKVLFDQWHASNSDPGKGDIR